jgi:hypothetical protein
LACPNFPFLSSDVVFDVHRVRRSTGELTIHRIPAQAFALSPPRFCLPCFCDLGERAFLVFSTILAHA